MKNLDIVSKTYRLSEDDLIHTFYNKKTKEIYIKYLDLLNELNIVMTPKTFGYFFEKLKIIKKEGDRDERKNKFLGDVKHPWWGN